MIHTELKCKREDIRFNTKLKYLKYLRLNNNTHERYANSNNTNNYECN